MSRVLILGGSGSGKSWYAGQKLESILTEDGEEAFEHAVHVDLEDEEKGLSLADDPLFLTAEIDKDRLREAVVVNPRNPPDYIPEAELKENEVVTLPKWMLYKNGYVRFVPDGLTEEEKIVLTEMCADAAMKAEDCHFSVDEAHLVANNSQMGTKLNRLVTGGRKRGVEYVFITQRPQAINKQIPAQANLVVYFRLSSGRDKKKAASMADAFDGEEELPKLGKREAIVEDLETGEWWKIDTNDLDRDYPHIAGDDGKADEKWKAESPSDVGDGGSAGDT